MTTNAPDQVKPQFSGHETFPLRQLWLLKETRFIAELRRAGASSLPPPEECIVRLGVGRNMVDAMRWWSEASGMVAPGGLELTDLGRVVFGDGEAEPGIDPNGESVATQWLVHWRLSSEPQAFTANWFVFNLLPNGVIERSAVVRELVAHARKAGWKASETTIRRSVEVALRSYLPRLGARSVKESRMEEFLDPYLSELDLMTLRGRDAFSLRVASHPTLPDELFAFALLEHWERTAPTAATLELNRIAHEVGSPGRVFKLDVPSVERRLGRLEALTDGMLAWTEQAGLRQVIRRGEALSDPAALRMRLLRAACAR